MKVQKRYARNIILVLFLALALITAALYQYNSQLTDRLSESMEATMSELADSQQHGINMELDAQLRTIELIANAVETREQDGLSDEEYLQKLLPKANFEYLAIWSKEGWGVDRAGQSINISDRAYYQRVVSGETVLSEPIVSRIDGRRMISMVTPRYRDGEVSAILMGMYTFEQFNSMLTTTFSGHGYAFIVNTEGEIIARTENYTITDNLSAFEIWREVEFHKGFTLEEIMRDIGEGSGGNSEYSYGDVRRLIEYRPLSQNGWMLVVVVPVQVVGSEAAAISREAALMTLLVIGCSAFGLCYIVLQRRSRDKERQSHVVELEQIAYYDALTNLPNLHKFRVITCRALETKPQKSCVILKLDILRFKVINDLFGFDVGNRVLLTVAQALRDSCLDAEHSDLRCLARAGADEFLLFDSCSLTSEEIDAALQSFEESVSTSLETLLGNHKLSFRYGVYILTPEQDALDEAIEKANLAHREAKQSESRNICYYNEEIRARVLREAELQNNMESAMLEGQFQVYLQPKYDLRNESLVGAEALVRWQEPSGNMVSPSEFIPIFEKNGLIVELDIHMFRAVCALLRTWIDEGLEPVRVSVNFSRLHLGKEHFVDGLVEIADAFAVPHHYIEIELTETIIFENETVLLHLLEELHRADFTLSMDDFGTGYSSLGLLKNLPVDVIKIDRSFFSASSQRMRTKAVLRSVVDMAKSLDIYTVAEGVETEDQVALLREIGCELVQGYYFARPMPIDQFTALLPEVGTHTALMY